MQRGAGGSSRNHGSSHHHHGSFSQQRVHRGSGGTSHAFSASASPSSARGGIPSHSDGLSKGSGAYMHSAMADYGTQGLPWGWHAGGSAPLGGLPHHEGSSNGVRSGHGAMGGHAKRHRGLEPPAASAQAGPHHDALMELARENLLLKHQLHVASAEVGVSPLAYCASSLPAEPASPPPRL